LRRDVREWRRSVIKPRKESNLYRPRRSNARRAKTCLFPQINRRNSLIMKRPRWGRRYLTGGLKWALTCSIRSKRGIESDLRVSKEKSGPPRVLITLLVEWSEGVVRTQEGWSINRKKMRRMQSDRKITNM
jgi:hypothetical protein